MDSEQLETFLFAILPLLLLCGLSALVIANTPQGLFGTAEEQQRR